MIELVIGFFAGAATVHFVPGVWHFMVDKFNNLVNRFK